MGALWFVDVHQTAYGDRVTFTFDETTRPAQFHALATGGVGGVTIKIDGTCAHVESEAVPEPSLP